MPLALAVLFALKTYAIEGTVTNERTGQRLPGALVLLQCTCLDALRETTTNADGRYRFGGLPPGTYTIQVLAGQADRSKSLTLPP